jgi:hypothetical protein
LRDENGEKIKDSKKKKIVITEGIEVVVFSEEIRDGEYTKILVWLDDKY